MKNQAMGNGYFNLIHNDILIRQAERTMSELANDENARLYLKNPDGTLVRVQAGCKLIFINLISIPKENETTGGQNE